MSFIIECPHCGELIEIIELNCKIFRHGIYKNSYQQINPHLNKSECDKLIIENLIYGCGKPFILVKDDSDHIYKAMICDYI